MPPEFDWIRHSKKQPADWAHFRFTSLREMLTCCRPGDSDEAPLLVGIADDREWVVTLGDLQSASEAASVWRTDLALPMQTPVVVLRLPYSSELLVAVHALSLMAAGFNVVLPTSCESRAIREVLQRSAARHIVAPCESAVVAHKRSTRAALEGVRKVAQSYGCAELPPLPLQELNHSVRTVVPKTADFPQDPDREVLTLTTSATTGQPKLIAYTERALLTVAESWEAAGLMSLEVTGGPSLCPLFSHSMGVRNVLHAVWNRQPTLMVPPEWLDEAPHRALSLLERWQPRHFTGGPALLHALSRLSRSSQQSRRILRSLRVIVSSGAPWDPLVRSSFPHARLANAFGMTETQQVLSTLLAPPRLDASDKPREPDSRSLGAPLPGVSVAVRFTDSRQQIGELHVNSQFAATRVVGEPRFDEWFATGDLVQVVGDQLEYIGRKQADFLSLGSGLKVPQIDVERKYAQLAGNFEGFTLRQSSGRLGLVAIAWCGSDNPDDPTYRRSVRELVEVFHERNEPSWDDFDRQHTRLVAIGLIPGQPPRRGPGKLDERSIADAVPELLAALDSASTGHPRIVELHEGRINDADWSRHYQPYIGQLLQALKLNVTYESGSADYLTRNVNGIRRDTVDLVGGFGSNLLGHHHAEIVQVATDALSRVPMLDQLSQRVPAMRLAETLSRRLGDATNRRYVCLFHSTGAEAVDTALKHALFRWRREFDDWQMELRTEFGSLCPDLLRECLAFNERQVLRARPVLLAIEGSYHGRTLGTLPVMSDRHQRNVFGSALRLRVEFLRRSELGDPEARLKQLQDQSAIRLRTPVQHGDRFEIQEYHSSSLLATIVEPVQGEGGIFEVPDAFYGAIARAQVPLILDEIQSGLGRTGSFPSVTSVAADTYVFGKSLGGGLAKISVTMIDRAVYCDEFDKYSGSTFSGDSLSCEVALRVLEIIERDEIAQQAARLGHELSKQLRQLQQRHPETIAGISGCGAMQGIELRLPPGANHLLAQLLQDRLGYLAASYLLHRFDVRVLPTLSASNTLRIEPSATFDISNLQQLTKGLDAFCRSLAAGEVSELIWHLVDPQAARRSSISHTSDARIASASAGSSFRGFRFEHQPAAAGARRIGFVLNPLAPADELLAAMPDLAELPLDQRLELVWRLGVVAECRPVSLFSHNLFGGRVWLSAWMIPAPPEVLDRWQQTGELTLVRRRLDEVLQLATERGCETVVFGAQTSVLSASATSLVPRPDIQVSSGNTLTVAVMLAQIEQARRRLGFRIDGRLAVVGAGGNIGRALSRWYAQRSHWQGPLVLIGRPGAMQRLRGLQAELQAATGACVELSEERHVLRDCDVIITAVSGSQPVIDSRHIHPTRRVLVADVSQPRAVSAHLAEERPNAHVEWTGLVRLPEDPEFRLTPRTPRGACFACAAEGILMGLEPQALSLCGPIDLHAVRILHRLARKYRMIEDTPLAQDDSHAD